MKYTLLEIVQTILSSMDGDEVNSINDTVESSQVAQIVKDTYFDIVSRMDLPEHYSLFELEASGTGTKPTLMFMPSDVRDLLWVKYNNQLVGETSPKYEPVLFKPLDEFINAMYNLSTEDPNVGTFTHTINGDSNVFLYHNDAFPTFYTTFDDRTLVFDSFLSSQESFLQKNQTQAYGLMSPTWTNDDAFVPNLDANLFSLLRNEAKAAAFAELKQVANQWAIDKSRRGWIAYQGDKKMGVKGTTEFDRLPNYGRRR
jgi:hypothetical protein